MKQALIAAILISGIAFATPAVVAQCAADLNRDTAVDTNDMLFMIGAWGPCASAGGGMGQYGFPPPPDANPCAADIAPPGAPDGEVNVSDLLALIGSWGNCTAPPPNVLPATTLWCEDFSLGNYSRWTGGGYSPNWSACTSSGFATERFVTPPRSHRSAVTCPWPESHRGYAGLRFQGDTVLPSYTTTTGGIEAPNGVVVTFHSWLSVPYAFNAWEDDRWMSVMTVTDDGSNNWSGVITLSLDDPSMRLRPVHVSSVTYAPSAPAFPLQQWVRTTVYINYYTEQMHVWQNGQKVCSATFSRAGTDLCQWHFGLYASGANSNITLYEDDISIVKLHAPLTDFTAEPRFPGLPSVCAAVP